MAFYMEAENYWGNIEYKRELINMTPEKIKKYATQLKFRIIEGSGTCIYIIGVYDNGKIVGIKAQDVSNCNSIMNKICLEIDAFIDSDKIIDINKKNKLLIYVLKNKFNIDDIAYLNG